MQPHTGSVITVINYLVPSIKLAPESFAGQTFYVRSIISTVSGHFIKEKYHLVRTIRNNVNSRVLELEVGKDYICFLEVRYDALFENFEFVKHRHTYVREEFKIYRNSENFVGEYISEVGVSHRIIGRKLSAKRLIFIDSFKDIHNPNKVIDLKYDLAIV